MPNITYIDGKYLDYEDSKIHVNDRGYHFGDAVYEVIVFNKNIFYDFDDHIQRLFKSLKSLCPIYTSPRTSKSLGAFISV